MGLSQRPTKPGKVVDLTILSFELREASENSQKCNNTYTRPKISRFLTETVVLQANLCYM